MMIMHVLNATTASPAFVRGGINPDGRLEPKTKLVLLWGPPGQEGMGLFRDSRDVPRAFSFDCYALNGEQWESQGKDPRKSWILPYPPGGSFYFRSGEVDYWTKHPMSQEEKDRLRTLSTARKKRSRPKR
jgi:hypothetical protein